MMFRRFAAARFNGSMGACGRDANGYSISVSGAYGRCLLSFDASTLGDAFAIVRACVARFPRHAVGLSRRVYGGAWCKPDYRAPCAAPDYRAARMARLTAYEKRGRRYVRVLDSPPDLLAIIASTPFRGNPPSTPFRGNPPSTPFRGN
jgi:hypothetical protein